MTRVHLFFQPAFRRESKNLEKNILVSKRNYSLYGIAISIYIERISIVRYPIAGFLAIARWLPWLYNSVPFLLWETTCA
jgi:hypothetical protein